nr:tyrosine-type recombinase/integrase [Oceanobacillus saliphilus]
MLIDDDGDIVEPVARFLKFKDNTGSARNTLRNYCYALKLYFEYLNQISMEFTQITIDNLGEFVRWLQNPYGDIKVTDINTNKKKIDDIGLKTRTARTINQIIKRVTLFYDYIWRIEEFSSKLYFNLKQEVPEIGYNGYKGFFHHLRKNHTYQKNILKLKEPIKEVEIYTPDEVNQLLKACNNFRDFFLIYLLYESGLRIGEALSLHLSDISPAMKKLYVKDRGELENGAEIKTVGSVRTLNITDDLANLYRKYIMEVHTEEVDTSFLFINLNTKEPLTYHATIKIFYRLGKKTNIKAYPHKFRHTSLTELWRTGEMRPETLKEVAGHKHIQTTQQLYVHPSNDDVREDWENAMKQKKSKSRKNGNLIE